jgi:ribosomal protein S18 acetylase RimI-like enzyme
LRIAAARRLLGPARGDTNAAARLITNAESHGIDLGHLWVSVGADGQSARQVCLAVVGAGRSAMFFTSAPLNRAEEEELTAVVAHVCGRLPGVDLGQCLLEPHEGGAHAAMLAAGFFDVGSLAYLRRAVTLGPGGETAREELPAGCVVRRYRSGDDAALIRGLERSYEGTLDCPELCGLRKTADVLESHRAAGQWDPAFWWVVEQGELIEGMLLLNPSPEMNSIELVYLGLAPGLRGRGVGRQLLAHGLRALVGRPEEVVTCAVDVRNLPALRLYRRMGFSEFARRTALVRPVGRGVEKRS